MDAFDLLGTLRISIQRAQLREVSERLVGLTSGLNGPHILFSPNVTEADLEQIPCAATEVTADFPHGFTVEEVCSAVGADLQFRACRTRLRFAEPSRRGLRPRLAEESRIFFAFL
jgi:hypothetical protein